MTVRREPWGTTVESEPVELFTLESGELRARITSFGATLVALEIPGGRGERADVVLGFDGLAGYESAHNPYFGGLVGRCANRIAGARFTLDGRKHRLSANEGRNHLHGGRRGFDRRPWRALSVRDDGLVLHLRSPAGEEGYPGRVDVQASFTLSTDALALHLEGTSDAPTPLALTQHVYFNLAGSGTILDHVLEVFSERIVVVDDALLPTGELAGVAGTVFDFRSPARIGERIEALRATPAGGYDVCYALDKPPGTLGLAARLREPGSGRVLELLTSEPGLQLYTGNRLDGLAGKGGRPIERFGGVCLEAQHFPDAVNHAGFPSVVLRPRERYRHDTVWRLPGRDR